MDRGASVAPTYRTVTNRSFVRSLYSRNLHHSWYCWLRLANVCQSDRSKLKVFVIRRFDPRSLTYDLRSRILDEKRKQVRKRNLRARLVYIIR